MPTRSTLRELPRAPRRGGTYARHARRILVLGHQSVRGTLRSVEDLDQLRRGSNTHRQGRSSGSEVDVLRSAIVLTSAALDASMSRLVRDVGSIVVRTEGSGARRKYIAYLRQELRADKV